MDPGYRGTPAKARDSFWACRVRASPRWVEWWTGDWFGFDPTNDREVADHHVVVARAREYGDVAPLSGVFGGSTSSLKVDVKVTLLA